MGKQQKECPNLACSSFQFLEEDGEGKNSSAMRNDAIDR
jgi:hypothetical protein